ncbi:Acetyl esterase [Arenibacter antarcticus]|uniref:Alpha/beta hydrolase n=1 Tax=Arenibacter antarcticus TaxID=2040469 RepID=A0ABW5VEA7_9FLAO|nr:alpha/beta hydrolase [Arenibacter sp. H213]MCM4167410.1 lipase [Arenibacter sp. H213]
MLKALVISVTLLFTTQLIGQNKTAFKEVLNVSYYADATEDAYIKSRCKLDIRYPEKVKDFSTVVWFHGGGLNSYDKYFPDPLLNQDLCIVSVNYRLSPKVTSPTYIEDAAAAVAWVFKNIESYGGNPDKIFVAGHSAGGYLAKMIGLDKQWLNNFDIDADHIAGLISLSGQTITHSTVRKERGIPSSKVIVDEYAPLYHAREYAPPLLLITGDRDLDMAGRYEENLYLKRLMETAGHTETRLIEIQGFGHIEMHNPGILLLIKEVGRISGKTDKKSKD